MINSGANATRILDRELAVHALQQGQRYELGDISADNWALDLRCSDVSQRNWSRVATGFIEHQEDATGRRLFLKQYVDRAGQWNEKLWAYERSGAQIAHEVLSQQVYIPRLVASDRTLLINAFEYVDTLSMDELLRADSTAFERAYPLGLERMVEVLEILRTPGRDAQLHLPRKDRDYGDGDVGLNFKGFEIRSLGVKPAGQSNPTRDDFLLFDFGRPYLAPIQEAAAKLLVSIGLLNWGRPLSRFTQGPDFQLLEVGRQYLAPYLDHAAVTAELRLQHSFRWAEIQAKGAVERSVKRLAITTVGGRYFRRLENWCRSALR